MYNKHYYFIAYFLHFFSVVQGYCQHMMHITHVVMTFSNGNICLNSYHISQKLAPTLLFPCPLLTFVHQPMACGSSKNLLMKLYLA